MSQQWRIRFLYALFVAALGCGVLVHFTPFPNYVSGQSDRAARTPEADERNSDFTIEWLPFSTEALQVYRSNGQTVLVFCHADWDVNSAVVEHALNGNKIREFIACHEIVLLDADTSFRNPPEVEKLKKSLGFGPNGVVPIVAVFRSSTSPPSVLPFVAEWRRHA